jgi:hypothetical protein
MLQVVIAEVFTIIHFPLHNNISYGKSIRGRAEIHWLSSASCPCDETASSLEWRGVAIFSALQFNSDLPRHKYFEKCSFICITLKPGCHLRKRACIYALARALVMTA